MNNVHYIHDDVAVVGWACRVPGANTVSDLWSLLLEGRCAVTRVPDDRFPLQKFGHPRRQERGKSYTWAAGVLDDIWGFDPGLFGISPREAVQMDPQQRILLQLTWEALEDAGIRPSSIAGTDVGVYVGASQIEYAHSFLTDQAIADSHFATGTSLAILANRISYIYDLQGPSLTVDTACSSSLVALHQAMEALRSGRVDTAIVGGINVISSPTSFIAFSQASMLSAAGLCQAFSAKADGFVRAEGGAVIVLRRATLAQASKNPIHGMVLATDVNSDGRTGGISLPSGDAQEALLKRVYARAGIDPDRLAFVEAHGTGTPAGDPIEATALGRGLALGRSRANVLPIGSIKTNIGHLEPASGIVGLLKALLALNHGILPPSLHCSERNPNIDFDRLNLTVCGKSLLLPHAAQQLAGVNSFGFGGTNAHAVVAPGRKPQEPAAHTGGAAGLFAFSGETSAAVNELARIYSERLGAMSDAEMGKLASAVIHRREHLGARVVVSASRSRDAARALNAFLAGRDDQRLISGPAVGKEMPVAFVYSGNGSQWAGMGLVAYRNNAAFRTHFELVDSYFKELAGWSLREAMFSETLTNRLPLTTVAQPLIFAIQSSATAALAARGLRPAAVLGHSVGEVAAAEAAGILNLRAAVEVIHHRSTHQELTRGKGRMAAVRASVDVVKDILRGVADVEIAAYNSPRAVTLAGRADVLAALAAENPAIPMIDLDLDYPFHTVTMALIAAGLTADLKDIVTRDADIPFVSTVTGECMPGTRINGAYWWRNVREPVQFVKALRSAATLGARYFVEIGPRPTLLKHITDSLDGEVSGFATLPVLERNDEDVDPFDLVIAKAFVGGAQLDLPTIFGTDPGPAIALPAYPWQQQEFRFQPTSEAIGLDVERQSLAGSRASADGPEWHANIDTAVAPDFGDHKVGDQVLFPGTGFLEIALSVAQQWLKTGNVIIADFEILKALDLTNGETREVMTRVSPGANSFEIFSRQRLSRAAWLLHCRGKMMHGHSPNAVRAPCASGEGQIVSGEALYRLAASTGLHYGPAFRLVTELAIHGDIVEVDLAPPASAKTGFLLDPIRLDCCSHGMFAVFPDVRAEERGVTYIPVRMDQVTLYRPRVAPHRARVEVLTKNSRAIVMNYYIFGADGEVVAVLRGVRCQAVQTRRAGAIESIAVLELPRLADGNILGDTGVRADAGSVVAAARALGLMPDDAEPLSDADMALEGWATAAALEIAKGLGDGGVVDVDLLVTGSRIPPEWQPWLVSLLTHLENAGLANGRRGVWTLADEALPSPDEVVNILAAEHPSRGAEVLLAGALTGFADRVASAHAIALPPESIVSPGMLDFYDAANSFAGMASAALLQVARQVPDFYPGDRMLRVLHLGFGPLVEAMTAKPFSRTVQLSVMEPSSRGYERAEIALSRHPHVRLLKPEALEESASYDLILSAGGLHRAGDESRLAYLRSLLAPRGMLLAVEPRPSLFLDMTFGLQSDWFTLLPGAEQVVGRLRSPDQWRAALARAGFGNAHAHLVGSGAATASLVVAEAAPARAEASAAAEGAEALVVTPAGMRLSHLATALASALTSGGTVASIIGADQFPEALQRHVVLCPGTDIAPADPVAALTQRCMSLKDCAERLGAAKTTLWIVFSGALGVGASAVRPVETGAWAFSRTLANEFPNLDVRRIDVAPDVAARAAAAHLAAIVRSGTAETELYTDGVSVHVVRVGSLARALKGAAQTEVAAVQLQRRPAANHRLTWKPIDRKHPGANEVEIAVAATGLNFRDLMWTLSLLPDDMLEDGFAGPTLGLECAGRVVRVGKSVKDFAVGDRVVALAASAFSTHVVAPAGQVAKIPESLTFEGAATIPVAFLTAYYSLIKLAQLKRGEQVLVHGGAGAVGMAAIQIAQWRGAHVIATAGSVPKRDLLTALGVRHVLDSRSTGFAEEVRAITGAGVDVVLNSLAGEAMEQSIACLKPFGRFVELGKRDYVSNTHVGLRPFRRNLSYFGVDLDQLVVGQKAVGEQLYRKVMRLFESGAFTPLPHSVFAGADVAAAFHLMQQSSHVGKIVVLPPPSGVVRAANRPWSVDANGTHVVTGAFGGFGLEVAKWLVDRGARHLVLVGRRGAVGKEAGALLEDFAARGVAVIADPCDVSDLWSLQQLFEKVRQTMPPVAGILHAAMVLDDAIVTNLTPERFHQVLLPKVRGAENLDLVTRNLSLDYFVLFSSVTTLMGNPGQGNYVAANAFMEGLARRRRQSGLAALAIGWGPITDVGVVANSERLRENLQKLTGVRGMRAREALDLMAQALEQPATAPEFAVMTISPNDGGFAVDRMPVLRSPTYASFVTGRTVNEGEPDGIDLGLMLKQDGVEAARRKVNDTIAVQLARVLHGRAEDISRVRLLGEIGLDSLMALELVMNLEQTFGLSLSLTNSVGALTVPGLADEIIAQVDAGRDRDAAVVSTMAGRHLENVEPAQVEALKAILNAETANVARMSS